MVTSLGQSPQGWVLGAEPGVVLMGTWLIKNEALVGRKGAQGCRYLPKHPSHGVGRS